MHRNEETIAWYKYHNEKYFIWNHINNIELARKETRISKFTEIDEVAKIQVLQK